MIKLLLVHRNLISLHRHRDIVKKNGVENFTIWSTWSNKKSQMTSENNTRSMQLVKLSFSWGTDKRIIIHNARISICVLQTCICIINILVDEVGKPYNRKEKQFPCRKENSYNFVSSVYFLLKMRERNILLCATVGILFSVSKEIKYYLYISC